MSSGCVFCRIVAGEAPASVVFEDELTLAFMDIRPVTPGHLLVVPKLHATHLADLPADTGAAIMKAAMRCAAALRASPVETDGINLFLADGAAAGQVVFHVHMHVLPRYAGDGFRLSLHYDPPPPRAALDEQASEIVMSLEF
jgi:diadenosine tetraphosphate (Ap4A) HIT family hydrolase